MNIDPFIVVRGLHFAATVLATGTAAFLTLIADTPPLRRALRMLTWGALALAVVTGAIWLVLLAIDLAGEAGAAWTVLAETRFGTIALVRLVLAAALASLMLWPQARWLALAAAALFIALLGWVGHSGASPGPAGDLQLLSDVVHLLTAGAWLGGLPALAMALAQSHDMPTRRKATRDIVIRFGTLGLVCVTALLITGLFNAWNLLASSGDLVSTDYGRLLLAKLALVAAMVGIAAINRLRLSPRAAELAAQRALRRNSLTEASLGLGALLLVGWLGALPPPAHSEHKHAHPQHEHQAAGDKPADVAFVHIHDAAAMAEVAILPGRVGTARASIHLMREDGMEFAAKEVRLALDPQIARTQPIELPAIHQSDGSWKVQRLEIKQPGIWTVRVIVIPNSGPPLTLDAPVVIEP